MPKPNLNETQSDRPIGITGQKTDTIKSQSDPNNLFEPIEGYDKTIPSFLDWFDFHPAAKWGTVAGVGALALLAVKILHDSESLK